MPKTSIFSKRKQKKPDFSNENCEKNSLRSLSGTFVVSKDLNLKTRELTTFVALELAVRMDT
jgi:hypothetical protein